MRARALHLLLSVTLASRASAACSCAMVARAGAPSPKWPRPAEAPVLFSGRALFVDRVSGGHQVRFVVDSSWRGPLPDTLTVAFGPDAPCAQFFPGMQYVVGAIGSITGLRLPSCADAYATYYWAKNPLLRELGPATWRPPPAAQRAVLRTAIGVGARAPPAAPGDSMSVILRGDSTVVEIHIADKVIVQATSMSRFIKLPAGLYRFRLQYRDSTVQESYVVLRCELSTPPYCGMNRLLMGR